MTDRPASSLELQRLWEAAQRELRDLLTTYVAATTKADQEPGAWAEVSVARGALARRLGEIMALADLLGRRRVLLDLKGARRLGHFELGPVAFSDPAQTIPRVAYKDALRDLTTRTPELAQSAAQVAEVYERHGFTAIQAVDETVLARVRAEIGQVIEVGQTVPGAAEMVARLSGWTRSYAQTVVRTNLTNAYSAGRFRQLADPEVRQYVPALRFVSVQEPWNPKTRQGTRPNHAACHGLVAAADDPVWDEIAPPLGFNCRCGVTLVTAGMVKTLGLLRKDGTVRPATKPRDGGPDPGFTHRGRPDRAVYA